MGGELGIVVVTTYSALLPSPRKLPTRMYTSACISSNLLRFYNRQRCQDERGKAVLGERVCSVHSPEKRGSKCTECTVTQYLGPG